MATSPYIHHYRDIGEQGLIQSITAETIFLGGRDMIYLPREDYNKEDPIFGQATQLIFRTSFNVAMMLESTEGFEGEGEFYSKFGLDIKDRVRLSCSRKTWEELNLESASPVYDTAVDDDPDGYDRLLLEPNAQYITEVQNLHTEGSEQIVTEDTENANTTQEDDLIMEVQGELGDQTIDRLIYEDSGGLMEVDLILEVQNANDPIEYLVMEEQETAGTDDKFVMITEFVNQETSIFFKIDFELILS